MKSARQAVRASLRTLDEAIRPLRRGRAGIKAVHEARTAAREVGDTLSTYGADLPVIKAEANALKDVLGEVRDLHVSGVRRSARLTHATRALRAAIADWARVRPSIDRVLEAFVAGAPPDKLLLRRLRKLKRKIKALPASAPPKQAHRLRGKIKRARTAVGLVAPEEEQLLGPLKRASKLLGKLHDLDAGLDSGGHGRRHYLRRVVPVLEELQHEL